MITFDDDDDDDNDNDINDKLGKFQWWTMFQNFIVSGKVIYNKFQFQFFMLQVKIKFSCKFF